MTIMQTIEYRIPIALTQDEQVQDLARQLAHERGQRRVPIRQIVREAITAYVKSHLVHRAGEVGPEIRQPEGSSSVGVVLQSGEGSK
jgi:hypothetical protein